jgi:hypothetical protein
MRILALALASLVVACNPSAPSGGAGGGLFPNLSEASYRAEATMYGENGETVPTVMIRSGNKIRMEVSSSEGEMAMVNDGDTGESFVLINRDGQTMAIAASQAAYQNPTANWSAEATSTATRTGTCSVAGETGAEWTRVEEGTSSSACVTSDGIILRAQEGDRVTWETTSVQRGPQAAALFTLPPGVQVMDLGSMISGAAAAAGNGNGNANAQVCDMLRNANAPPEAMARAGC